MFGYVEENDKELLGLTHILFQKKTKKQNVSKNILDYQPQYIKEGTNIKGTVHVQRSITIDGYLDGNIIFEPLDKLEKAEWKTKNTEPKDKLLKPQESGFIKDFKQNKKEEDIKTILSTTKMTVETNGCISLDDELVVDTLIVLGKLQVKNIIVKHLFIGKTGHLLADSINVNEIQIEGGAKFKGQINTKK